MAADGIRFVKMEGAGNDYVYVDCFEQKILNPAAFTRRVSRRHFGIGSDGVILIRPSKQADCFMDIYNADGSRGRACGNGLRCAAWFMYQKCGQKKRQFRIETLSGIRQCQIEIIDQRKAWVRVQMGSAEILDDFGHIPLWEVARRLPPGIRVVKSALVDTGNIHCVLLLEKSVWEPGEDVMQLMAGLPIFAAGDFLENYDGFPERVNVEFCMAMRDSDSSKLSDTPCGNAYRVRVWERGSKETMACGSGACAVYAALGNRERPGCIFMNGGRLNVECDESRQLYLSGEAVMVFEGCVF